MWPSILWALISTLPLAQPLVLGEEPVTIALVAQEDKALSERLAAIAHDPTQNVVLLLQVVEADAPPGASWEVYVGPADAKPCAQSPRLVGPRLVGIVSLFGQGIRSEASEDYQPAEFAFPLDRAIVVAGANNLHVTFVATSGVVVGGRPAPAEVHSTVTIGAISLAVDSAQPQQPEQELRREQEE